MQPPQPNNPQDRNSREAGSGSAGKNWFLRHEFLYIVIGVLLLVVIVGSVAWWKVIKNTPQSTQYIGDQTNTIAGVDADNNGIRDDIQAYIQTKYVGQPDMILALDSYAKAEQAFLTDASDKNQTIKDDAQREKITGCLLNLKGDTGYDIRDDLRAHILNTIPRNLAYEKADNNLGGMTFTAPVRSCDGVLNTTTLTDTSTWKTYTNSQYGFSFEYPPDLLYYGSGQNNKIPVTLENQDMQIILAEENVKFSADAVGLWSGFDPIAEGPLSTTLGQQAAYEIKGGKTIKNPQCEGEQFFTSLPNNQMLTIILDNSSACKDNSTSTNPLNVNLVTQILSTFKFIPPQTSDNSNVGGTPPQAVADSSSAVDTSTWKTYTDSQYGYKVQYPKDWQLIDDDSACENNPNKDKTPEDITIQNFPRPEECGYSGAGGEGILLNIHVTKNINSLDSWRKMILSNSMEGEEVSNEVNLLGSDGLNGSEFTVGCPTGTESCNGLPDNYALYKVVIHNSNAYTFGFEDSIYGEEALIPYINKYKNQFNQILSTFKFTN